MDYMLRATAAEGQILAFACTSRATVEEARARHNTTPVVTAALGRSLTAAAMMGWQMKGEKDQLTLRIEGSGPIGMINVDANRRGEVWGFAKNSAVDLPLNQKGKLDVAGAIGVGVMSIIKDLGMKEPYCGQTHLITSEIAEDLAYYFTASEQVPSAVALGVLVDRDYSVLCAGGFIFQMMPGASDETAAKLQEKVVAFPSVTEYFSQGNTPEDLLNDLLGDMGLEILEKQEVRFQCNCNRDRVTRALISIGEADLRELAEEGEDVELRCDCCNEPYSFTPEELSTLADIAARNKKARKEEE
mgnify:CR=1 FL=1